MSMIMQMQIPPLRKIPPLRQSYNRIRSHHQVHHKQNKDSSTSHNHTKNTICRTSIYVEYNYISILSLEQLCVIWFYSIIYNYQFRYNQYGEVPLPCVFCFRTTFNCHHKQDLIFITLSPTNLSSHAELSLPRLIVFQSFRFR